MKIVFHGANAETFLSGFADHLEGKHELILVSDGLEATWEAEAYSAADVVIGVRRGADAPPLSALLYQVAGAGTDGVDRTTLPAGCTLCNVYGHEMAITEYVFAALLARHVPLVEADAQLRAGDWHYWAGKPTGLRTELGAQRIGIVGYGHIGQALAARARAFGMSVHVANRSAIAVEGAIVYPLTDLAEMAAQVDILINTLPLAPGTAGLIGAEVLGALPSHALVMNVGRGAVIDPQALYDVLNAGSIEGAIIDTWYQYPSADNAGPMPAAQPFERLKNLTMTPHMSGWTHGTIARRRADMAENINRLAQGEALMNIVP